MDFSALKFSSKIENNMLTDFSYAVGKILDDRRGGEGSPENVNHAETPVLWQAYNLKPNFFLNFWGEAGEGAWNLAP